MGVGVMVVAVSVVMAMLVTVVMPVPVLVIMTMLVVMVMIITSQDFSFKLVEFRIFLELSLEKNIHFLSSYVLNFLPLIFIELMFQNFFGLVFDFTLRIVNIR